MQETDNVLGGLVFPNQAKGRFLSNRDNVIHLHSELPYSRVWSFW